MKQLFAVFLFCAVTVGTVYAQPRWQWATPIKGRNSDQVRCLAIHNDTLFTSGSFSDSMYVGTEKVMGLGNYDIFVSQVDKTGKSLRTDVFGGLYADDSYSVVVDNKGNYYLSGSFITAVTVGGQAIGGVPIDPEDPESEASSEDIFVAKFNRMGACLWVSVFGSAEGDEGGVRLALDTLGNVYMGGYCGKNCLFTDKISYVSKGLSDAFVAKLDSEGKVAWVYGFGGPDADLVKELAVTPNGDRVYAVGTFAGSVDLIPFTSTKSFNNKDDYFLVSLDGAGKAQWGKRIGSVNVDQNIYCTVDKDRKLVVVGSFTGKTTFDAAELSANGSTTTDVFVSRWKQDGSIEFLKRYGGSSMEVPLCVTTDARGAIYIGGWFAETSTWDQTNLESKGSSDGFVARLFPDGTLEWIRDLGGEYGDDVCGIVVSKDNIPYVAGTFDTKCTFGTFSIIGDRTTDSFIAALECGPNTRLVPALDSVTICQGSDSTISAPLGYPAYQWTIDGEPTGPTTAKLDISKLPMGTHKVAVLITDFYDCRKSSDTIVFTISDPLPKPTITRDNLLLTCDYEGVDYAWFHEGVQFGANSKQVNMLNDGTYRVRIRDSAGCSAWSDPLVIGVTNVEELDMNSGIRVFPNPTSSSINITGLGQGAEVIMFDALGNRVQRMVATDALELTALSEQPNGLYTLFIQTNGKRYVRMVLKR